MKVLLVAEGKHERGTEDRDGALETLVRRLHQNSIQCDLDRVSRKDIHAHHGKSTLERRCARGFAPFAQRVRSL
jgi:hypothetical protein